MYSCKRKVRSQSAKTPDEIRSICKHLHSPVPYIYDEEFEIDYNYEIAASKWILGESCPTNDLAKDVSDNGDLSALEERHFERAFSNGMFSGVTAQNKRERKRLYRKVCKSIVVEKEESIYNECDENDNRDQSKVRSRTRNNSNSSSHEKCHRRKSYDGSSNSNVESKIRRRRYPSNHGEQIRRELSNSGMDLIDMSDSLEIEEIHALQERFFSSMTMKDGYQVGKTVRSNSVF